jgi:hypothetical protein
MNIRNIKCEIKREINVWIRYLKENKQGKKTMEYEMAK